MEEVSSNLEVVSNIEQVVIFTNNVLDGDGNIMKLQNYEAVRRYTMNLFLNTDDKVLELGGGYGFLTVFANKTCNVYTVVEPNSNMWSVLEQNKTNTGSTFNIIKGFLAKRPMGFGESGPDENSTVPYFTELPQESNTLIADCEGGLTYFFDDFPEAFDQFNKIFMDEDGDYESLKESLVKNGFYKMFNHSDFTGLVYSVWIKTPCECIQQEILI